MAVNLLSLKLAGGIMAYFFIILLRDRLVQS